MQYLELFPPPETVQRLSNFIVEMDTAGIWKYLTTEAAFFYALILLATSTLFADANTDQKNSMLKRIVVSDVLFLLAVVAFLLLARIPLAVVGQVNPDEANWVAISKTLWHDPRYWVSADGGTGGPIVSFALLPLKILGIPIDFGSIKILAVVMMGLSISFVYLGFAQVVGKASARFTVLPVVVAVSVMRRGDLIGYNSEHPAILMLCIALFLLGKVYATRSSRSGIYIVLLGIVLGSVPFAKLQAAPMAVVLGLTAILVVWRMYSLKKTGILILSALIPSILTVIVVALYGGLNDFWLRFIGNNVQYANTAPPAPFFTKMIALTNIIYEMPEMFYFFDYTFICIMFGLFLIACMMKATRDELLILLFGFLFACSAVFSINFAGRFFHHYVLFMIFPLVVFLGTVVYVLSKSFSRYFDLEKSHTRLLRLIACAVIFVTPSFYYFQNKFTFRPEFAEIAKNQVAGYIPPPFAEVIAVLNRYYSPDAKMAIWGWAYELWACSEFQMGTRDMGNMGSTNADDYYTKTYLKDLERNKPLLFVETVAPDFFVYKDRSVHGFEINEDVKKYIYEHYYFETEIRGARIFRRKDAPPVKNEWITRGLPKPPDRTDGFSQDFALTKMGTVLQFRGWMIFNPTEDSLKNQRVRCLLYNKTDTILIDSYKKRDWVVESYFKNPNFRFAGYEGYIDCNEISPKGDYNVGLYVENNGLSLFVDKQRTITIDENCQSFK